MFLNWDRHVPYPEEKLPGGSLFSEDKEEAEREAASPAVKVDDDHHNGQSNVRVGGKTSEKKKEGLKGAGKAGKASVGRSSSRNHDSESDREGDSEDTSNIGKSSPATRGKTSEKSGGKHAKSSPSAGKDRKSTRHGKSSDPPSASKTGSGARGRGRGRPKKRPADALAEDQDKDNDDSDGVDNGSTPKRKAEKNEKTLRGAKRRRLVLNDDDDDDDD